MLIPSEAASAVMAMTRRTRVQRLASIASARRRAGSRWQRGEPVHTGSRSTGAQVRRRRRSAGVRARRAAPPRPCGSGDDARRDPSVLDVVLDVVVAVDGPAAPGQREQERLQGEADDDRREHERLGHGIGRPDQPTDDRRDAGPAAGGDDQQVDPVAEQADADDDARQAAVQHRVHAGAARARRSAARGRGSCRQLASTGMGARRQVAEHDDHHADHQQVHAEVEDRRRDELDVADPRQLHVDVRRLQELLADDQRDHAAARREQDAHGDEDHRRQPGDPRPLHRSAAGEDAEDERRAGDEPTGEAAAGGVVPGAGDVHRDEQRQVEDHPRALLEDHRLGADLGQPARSATTDVACRSAHQVGHAERGGAEHGDLEHRVDTAEVDDRHVDHVAPAGGGQRQLLHRGAHVDRPVDAAGHQGERGDRDAGRHGDRDAQRHAAPSVGGAEKSARQVTQDEHERDDPHRLDHELGERQVGRAVHQEQHGQRLADAAEQQHRDEPPAGRDHGDRQGDRDERDHHLRRRVGQDGAAGGAASRASATPITSTTTAKITAM